MGQKMNVALQHLFGTAFIVVVITAALQLSGCSSIEHQMDANEKCPMSHVWEQTTVSTGRPLYECPGWFRERRVLDAQEAGK